MKTLKHLSAAGLLTVFLALSAHAGEIQLGWAPPPPAPPPAAAPATEPGDIYIPGTTQGFAGPTATEIALNLLQELLLVF